jgi:hypothetical protein
MIAFNGSQEFLSTQKTVFVLGASASRPYGLPTGGELRTELCASCHQKPAGRVEPFRFMTGLCIDE